MFQQTIESFGFDQPSANNCEIIVDDNRRKVEWNFPVSVIVTFQMTAILMISLTGHSQGW